MSDINKRTWKIELSSERTIIHVLDNDDCASDLVKYNIVVDTVQGMRDLINYMYSLEEVQRTHMYEWMELIKFGDDFKAEWLRTINSPLAGEENLRLCYFMWYIEDSGIYLGRSEVFFFKVRNALVSIMDIEDSNNDKRLWAYREKSRLYNKVYNPVTPDANFYIRHWMTQDYAHMSVNDNKLIAYTPDDAWGRDDRQLRTRIGKYINKLISDEKVILTEDEVRDQVTIISAGNEIPELLIARTCGEIDSVYCNGPSSCMQPGCSEAGDLATGDESPAQMYATPDLGVAYFKNGLGAIKARCVVNMKDKEYVRIYGDAVRLTRALEDGGFTAGTIEGCRLLKIKHDGYYMMSYLDDVGRVNNLDEKYFILDSDGEYDAQQCSGLLDYNEDRSECWECGDRYDEDDMTWINRLDRQVCQCCLENEYSEVRGRYGTEYYANHECNAAHDIFEWGDENCTREYMEYTLNLVYIEDNDCWYDSDDVVQDHFTDEWIVQEDATEFYARMEDGDLDKSETLYTADEDQIDESTIEVPAYEVA